MVKVVVVVVVVGTSRGRAAGGEQEEGDWIWIWIWIWRRGGASGGAFAPAAPEGPWGDEARSFVVGICFYLKG